MRAWQLHDTNGPQDYSLDEISPPEPQAGEVVVRPQITAINHLDLWISQGLPRPHSLPHIPGADAAGVVTEVGEGVDSLVPGDEVIVNPSISCGQCSVCRSGSSVFCRKYGIMGEHFSGTMTERFKLPVRNLVKKPTSLSWEIAGSFGLATGTAFRMLERARLRAGEVLLVVGVGGGVSSAAMLLGKIMGARVFVTSRDPKKIEWAITNGAEAGFDSGGEFGKELKGVVRAGANVVVENVGPATWKQSVSSTASGGRIVVCGSTSGTKVELTVPVLFFKQIEIIGSTMFTYSEFERLCQLMENGELAPPVDTVYEFSDFPQALERMQTGQQLGKLAFRF